MAYISEGPVSVVTVKSRSKHRSVSAQEPPSTDRPRRRKVKAATDEHGGARASSASSPRHRPEEVVAERSRSKRTSGRVRSGGERHPARPSSVTSDPIRPHRRLSAHHVGGDEVEGKSSSKSLRRSATTRTPTRSHTVRRTTPRLARSASMRDVTTTSAPARAPLRRSSTSNTRQALAVRSSASVSRSKSTIREKSEVASEANRERRRSGGLLTSLFGNPPPPLPRLPEKKVECLTCLSDDIPISKSAKLGCGHIMCHDCLQRIFNLSVTDPQHMPPKCCTQDHIPLKHVERLFDLKFKVLWNRKYQEFTTKNRLYCPTKGCGEWIKPGSIHSERTLGKSRKYGKCSRCRTKVCCICNGKWHAGRDCPKDEETHRFIETAKKEGWQRCHNCSAMVELKEGCNHMTCRCTAEFCMICGAKWKTCNCPWFNYEQIQTDRLNHFNIAMPIRVMRQRPRGARADQPGGYEEELRQRRQQEARDEAFARRIQVLDLNLDGDADANNLHRAAHIIGLGNAGGHHMNDDYVRAAATLLGGAYDQAAAAANAAFGLGAARNNNHHRDDNNNGGRRSPTEQLQDPFAAPAAAAAHVPLRHHSTASRRYNAQASTRASERVVPRRSHTDYAREYAHHVPLARLGLERSATTGSRRRERGRDGDRGAGNEEDGGNGGGGNGNGNEAEAPPERRRRSLLAGLTRHRHGEGGRVGAWLQHVEEGAPVPG